MKTLITCSATALLLLAEPAAAQDKTLNPNDITVQAKQPTLQLNEQQRSVIQDALVTENTEQKVPPNFQPKVGDAVPLSMNVDVMPERLLAQEPSLQPFGYAKTAKELLVIDPMKKEIIAVLPRKEPTAGKDLAPPDWAATKGRELTGQAPEPAGSNAAPEPAGDTGDKSNGNEKNANQK
jgi:hypothetical protein